MNEISQLEKERLVNEFYEKQEREYGIGKVIVLIIAAINIVNAVIAAFIKLDVLSLVIQIILSTALFLGVAWVRYLFAIGAAAVALIIMLSFVDGVNASTAGIIYMILYMAISIISSIVLFASKSVSEFLYRQKNG